MSVIFKCFNELTQLTKGTDVLNQYSCKDNPAHIVQLMQSIFPRQFKLPNVFTSVGDSKETAHLSKASTSQYRTGVHDMLAAENDGGISGAIEASALHLPRRLRSKVFHLIAKLQTRHGRCCYSQLLNHYCPLPNIADDASYESIHFPELANSHTQVSAFCRAVITKVVPFELLGEAGPTEENWSILMRSVGRFISLRRFESTTLENVLRGIKVSKLTLFGPPNARTNGEKMAMSEFHKRSELLAELVYWILNSFLIPLIRCNFYVTESAVHKHRLFYFRHDTWRRMTAPAKETLKQYMLEPVDPAEASAVLEGRALGYTQLRFLPKRRGMRPIANLRRRVPLVRNGKKFLGKSINAHITPAFNVINYEKVSWRGCCAKSFICR